MRYRKYLGLETTEFGQTVAAYSEWKEALGSVQPAGERTERVNGVDFAQSHYSVWVFDAPVTGNHNQKACDQIEYQGRLFNVIAVDDWLDFDNYRKLDCVEVMNADGWGQVQ